MQSTEEQMPAPELQRVATSTKCFQRMHIGDPLWGHSPTEGFLLEEVPGGTTGAHPTKPCRITKHLLLTQAQPAFGIYIRWCEGPESWQPNGLHSLLIATGRKHLFFLKWEGNSFLPGLCQQSAYLACGAGAVGKGNLAGTSLSKRCQRIIFLTCISKDRILVSPRQGRILRQKSSVSSKWPLVCCPGWYQTHHSICWAFSVSYCEGEWWSQTEFSLDASRRILFIEDHLCYLLANQGEERSGEWVT